MAIKKTIKFTTKSITLPPTSSSNITYPPTTVLPLGEKPEGNLEDPLDRLDKVTKQLFANIDKLGENIKKLKEENKRLKEALGIVEDPLILTPNMEIKDEYK